MKINESSDNIKFYIASGLKNWKQVQEFTSVLEENGWENVYNWAKFGLISNTNSTSEELAQISHEQLQAVIDSDVIIIILTMGRGTHVELGAAVTLCELGMPKKIYLYSKEPEYFEVSEKTAGIYHNKFLMKKTGNIAEVINSIIDENSFENEIKKENFLK